MSDHGTTERYDEGCRCPSCVVAQTGRVMHANREATRRTLAELLETEIELPALPAPDPDPELAPEPDREALRGAMRNMHEIPSIDGSLAELGAYLDAPVSPREGQITPPPPLFFTDESKHFEEENPRS